MLQQRNYFSKLRNHIKCWIKNKENYPDKIMENSQTTSISYQCHVSSMISYQQKKMNITLQKPPHQNLQKAKWIQFINEMKCIYINTNEGEKQLQFSTKQ